MAVRNLTNTAEVLGYVNSIPTTLTDAVTIQLVEDLEVEKIPDRYSWAGGPLTFTVKITNNSGVPYSDVKVFDTLDVSKIDLVPFSINYDAGTVTYSYDAGTGDLEIDPIPALTLNDGETATFTFQVTKVPVSP